MAQTGAGRRRSERPIHQIQRTPVVYSAEDLGLKTKRRARRGSSRTARRLEDIERRLSRATRRVARATEHGVSEYIDRRDRSASARRDGALVDFYENVARGVSVGLAEASPVTVDVAKAFNTRNLRRQIRRTLASLPRIPVFG
jgi:hypothetical protein